MAGEQAVVPAGRGVAKPAPAKQQQQGQQGQQPPGRRRRPAPATAAGLLTRRQQGVHPPVPVCCWQVGWVGAWVGGTIMANMAQPVRGGPAVRGGCLRGWQQHSRLQQRQVGCDTDACVGSQAPGLVCVKQCLAVAAAASAEAVVALQMMV
jgi:hypothetical protein